MSNWTWYCFDCNEPVIDYFDSNIEEQWYKRWFHRIHNCFLVNRTTHEHASNRWVGK